MDKEIIGLNMKHFEANKKLYIWLLSVSVVILIVTICLQIVYINNIYFMLLMPVLLSINAGFIASVIVAWLIDIANCKKQNHEYSMIVNRIYIEFVESFNRLLQSFADVCFWYDDNNIHESLIWREWLTMLFEYGKYDDKEHFCEIYGFVNTSLDRLLNSIEKLDNNDVLLYSLKIISPEDISKVNGLRMMCYFAKLDKSRTQKINRVEQLLSENINWALANVDCLNTLKHKLFTSTNFG